MGSAMFLLKKLGIFFLLISGSLLSTSFAGGRSKLVNEEEGTLRWEEANKEEVRMIHERVLKANTRDYGRYDPSPTLSKPHFKLIPN